MISADEARKNTIKKTLIHIGNIENEIKYAMQNGDTCVIITDQPYCNWGCQLGCDDDRDFVISALKDLGYRITNWSSGYAGITTLAEFASQSIGGLKIDWGGDGNEAPNSIEIPSKKEPS